MYVYRLKDGETHWVIANDLNEAKDLFCKAFGFTEDDADWEDVTVDILNDDESFTLQKESYRSHKGYIEYDWTVAKWKSYFKKPRLICSTAFL